MPTVARCHGPGRPPTLARMTGRSACSAALVAALWVGVVAAIPTPSASAANVPPPPLAVDSWAFCGVNPDDPSAAAGVRALADAGGIDATFRFETA